jgi:hypothetical protein
MSDLPRRTLSLSSGTRTEPTERMTRVQHETPRTRAPGEVERMIQNACGGLDLDTEQMSQAEAFARRLMS